MGFMAGCPIAGVIWQHIHYIVGLQRLGHEVFYVEDSARYPYNPVTFDTTDNFAYAGETLSKLAHQFGFEDRWSYCARYLPGQDTAGFPKARIVELYEHADAILNVCGAQEFNDDLVRSERIIYVESDPGVEQIRVVRAKGDTIPYLGKHHALFTFGENIGTAKFPVPLGQFQWHTTRQPIVTEFWKSDAPPPAGARFTSVANWSTSGLKDIEWNGSKFLWSKSLEFLKFIEAPRRAGEILELATDIPDPAIAGRFRENGWLLSDPYPLSADHEMYRRYLHSSKGEFTVAKDLYVRLNTGWFSDRSACYLASGRPVITQETGFSAHYGGGGGLFGFKSLEDIERAVDSINTDYAAHCRAALDLAHEYFEAEKIMRSLLDRAGI